MWGFKKKDERRQEEKEEESCCPICHSPVEPGETECYLCGADLSEEALNNNPNEKERIAEDEKLTSEGKSMKTLISYRTIRSNKKLKPFEKDDDNDDEEDDDEEE